MPVRSPTTWLSRSARLLDRTLRELYLDGIAAADLTPLAGLTGLQTLSLDNTAVADLTPLAGLSGLQTLFLDNTAVADLTPLAGLTACNTCPSTTRRSPT